MCLTSDEAWPECSCHGMSYQGQSAALLPTRMAFRNLQVLVITFHGCKAFSLKLAFTFSRNGKAEDLQGAVWRGLHTAQTLPQWGPPKE